MDRLEYKIWLITTVFSFCLFAFSQNIDDEKDTLLPFKEYLNIKKLNSNINTDLDEYWPTITADEERMFFTRKSSGRFEQEDFYVSEKRNNKWQRALPLSSINTHENEGAQSISADGNFFVFTACNRKDGEGSCDLYYTIKVGDDWITPVNMGKTINTSYWETQPSLSADGKKLYFVSNRKAGKGKMDIWVTDFLYVDEFGKIIWSKPKNLNINTSMDELSPFIHHNGIDLYFASNGYKGYGGLDLFVSRRDTNGIFSMPKNLGNNINSPADEMGFVVAVSGEKAFFSSSMSNSNDKDIYSLNIPKEVKPMPITYFRKGKVVNQTTSEPIIAQLTVINKYNKHDKQNYFSEFKNGNYLICVNKGSEYYLHVSAEGFLYYAELINTRDSITFTHYKNIYLKPIISGEKVVLKHTYFDFDSYTLKPSSFLELKNVVSFLNQNLTLKIMIAGHTDHIGSDAYNLNLSIRRAKSVYKYFVKQGVDKNRLSFKGFGKNQPVDVSKTDKARAKNRRTEIIILE